MDIRKLPFWTLPANETAVGADLSAQIRINLSKSPSTSVGARAAGMWMRGPLWSPVVLVPLPHHVINKLGYTGDHKGPPCFPSSSLAPTDHPVSFCWVDAYHLPG